MEIKLTITACELLYKGLWTAFCRTRGIDEYSIRDGRMESNEEFDFNYEELAEIDGLWLLAGLLKG